jgi:HD-like signal output (HDOD) protein/ActR/RegA family two-component response regulator
VAGTGERVLFVADDPVELRRLERAFEDQKWDKRFVADAGAALASAAQEPPDVVVSAFGLEGMNGVELLTEVRSRHPDTVRLLLLGDGDEQEVVRAATVAHRFLAGRAPVETIVETVDGAVALQRGLDVERVRAEMAGIDVLLSPHGVFAELLRVLETPTSDAAAIARVVERDVALSAKLLQLANSSFFAPRTPITSVAAAVVRLGTQAIRSLAIMDGMIRNCDARDKVLRSWLTRFNTHALEVASLAERLADQRARQDAFCAGLLHDCGQLVFATCRPEVFSAHLRLNDDRRLLVELEEETFGITHAQAGAYFLTLWGLPLEVIRAAGTHTDALPPAKGRLGACTVAHLAHQLVEAEVLRLCSPPGTPGPADAALQQAGVLGEVWAWRAERATG